MKRLFSIAFLGFLMIAQAACGTTDAPAADKPATQQVPLTPPIDPRSRWSLDMHDPGSAAILELSPDQPEMMHVRITRATVPVEFNIQLRKPGLGVSAGESMTLSFRARADQPREIAYGIAMGHAPWEGLGFHGRSSIGPDWKDFSIPVVITTADTNAQLMFNLGGSPASVDLDKIVLRRMPSGEIVKF